jgi:glycosyltransferase involved in cell wall biosynthesis
MITLPPGLGGIATQARMVRDFLQPRGFAVTTAWRAHYSKMPHASVPSWRFWQRPLCEPVDGVPYRAFSVGTYLPEFEWAHHLAWGHWRHLIDSHEKIVVVSGNNLPGWAPHAMGRKALNWIASDYWGDRQARVSAWPPWRRIYDSALNAWITRRQEKILLETSDTWAIGEYARQALQALTPRNRVRGIIVIPVDTALFRPDDRSNGLASVGKFKIGFSGRTSDPRKNMLQLVEAFALFLVRNPEAELHVRGDLSRAEFVTAYNGQTIAHALHVGPPVARADMPDFLRSLDCFALMSHQEGLSQIAMEAMACGTCVVSTRCGGPEEFVLDGETGILTSFESTEIAAAFERLAGDVMLRRRLGAAGAANIAANYSPSRFESQFMAAMNSVFS